MHTYLCRYQANHDRSYESRVGWQHACVCACMHALCKCNISYFTACTDSMIRKWYTLYILGISCALGSYCISILLYTVTYIIIYLNSKFTYYIRTCLASMYKMWCHLRSLYTYIGTIWMWTLSPIACKHIYNKQHTAGCTVLYILHVVHIHII